MPVVIPNTVRTVLRFTEGTEERVNVFHIVQGTPPTVGDLDAINALFSTWDNNHYRLCRTPPCLLQDITSTSLHVANGPQKVLFISPPRPGTSTGVSLPGNVTSTISWRTFNTGRRFRGRTFVPDTANDRVLPDERITSGRVAELASAATELIAIGFPSAGGIAVASRVLQAATPILSFVVENILDSQRRRLPGRGR